MTSTNAERRPPGRGPRRRTAQQFSCRLLCCSCLRGEEKDPLQGQERKMNGGPQQPRSDQKGSGEREAIQITVEDLGIVNTSFSLLEEDLLTPRNNMGRSGSSVSACRRALKKKRLQRLSSLPLQLKQAFTSTSEEEDEALPFGSGSDSLLTSPVIHLIPPTPSDVTDDDQFFDMNSEEGLVPKSGSDGSFGADQESFEEKMDSETDKSEEENTGGAERAAKPEDAISERFREDREAPKDEDKSKLRFLRSTSLVDPLPEHPQRNDLSHDVMTDLRLLPQAAKMDSCTKQRTAISCSSGLGDTLSRSATFHALTQTSEQQQEEKRLPRQRRKTVESYIPPSTDQKGNFPVKDMDRQESKCLREMNTDGVCQWFSGIGLQKCLPSIREAELCGADIASVDMNTLEVLGITTLEDRELLLSAIYNELHPPSIATHRLDSLLESAGPDRVEAFRAPLVSMSKSKSSPHVSCLSRSRRSLKLRNNDQNYQAQRNSQLLEITINASERIVHLRTPRETTVGKIMDSCVKMLGMTEDRGLFSLREQRGSSAELSPDQQIGSLLTSPSVNKQLELHLCKMEKPANVAVQTSSEVNGSSESSNKNVQLAKEERIRELNQQVESLQNVILQVQELHHSLVAFCSELKNKDGEVNIERLGTAELKQKLDLVKSRLHDKRQSLQTLREHVNNSAAHKKKQLDVRLLEKMKLNCQVFKEEISMVHLNRQVAHLQNALQGSYAKEKAEKSLAVGSLSQLVSPQSPVMLVVVQENQGPDGCYGFTCVYTEGRGLVVEKVDNSHLCVGDRLVEVNGVPVVNTTEEELSDLLLKVPSAQIIVLRQPPILTSQQHPLLPQHMVNPNPLKTIHPERDLIAMETPSQRKVMAI